MTAEAANEKVWEALAAHFRRSADPLRPEQVVEMTAFELPVVTNALAVLHNNGQIEGHCVDQVAHPLMVTGVNYQY